MSIPSTGFSRDTNTPLTVSVKKARQLLDLGNTKIWELIRDGQLKTITVGRKRLVIYSSLEALISDAA
jgi:excisionase family DNA binding protein